MAFIFWSYEHLLKACINTRSIPFGIKASSYEHILGNRLKKEAEDPENLSPGFRDVDSPMESLNA